MILFFSVCAAIVAILLIAGVGLAGFARRTARRVEAALPPQGKFVEIDGCAMHYVDRGNGPVILMIHGLGGQVRHFTHSLTDRLSGAYRVVAIDRPGSGCSTRPAGASAGVAAQADTIAKFIRALNLGRPLVVGHSLGGAVSLALAVNHPDCVGGLALIAPLTHPRESVPEVFKGLAVSSAFVRWIVAWTLAIPMSIAKSKVLLEVVFGPEAVPADFPTAAGGLLSLRPRAFVAASSDLMAANDDLPGLVDRYASLNIPVGILFGRGDRILDPQEQGSALERAVRGARLTLIDGGHMLPITQPDYTATWIGGETKRALKD